MKRRRYNWEARMISPRRPPVEEVFKLHLPRQPGKCDWCGKPQEERTPVRKQLKARHADCETEYLMILRPEQARWQVEKRDKGICASCGEDWSLMSKFRPEFRHADGTIQISYETNNWRSKNEIRIPSTSLTVISLWHVDHKVPLWKVHHMPALERLEYFKIGNLVTLCEPCHKRKTVAEAAERASFIRSRAPKQKQEPLPW